MPQNHPITNGKGFNTGTPMACLFTKYFSSFLMGLELRILEVIQITQLQARL